MKKLKSDAIYSRLIDHMNEAVWIGDKNERTVHSNPKFCELMGFKLEEMLGRKSYEFWDKESAERVREVNRTKRKRGLSSSYEGNLLTKSGEKIPVLLSGTPLPDGGTIGIMTDLSEIRKKEEKEKMLNKAIHFASDAIIIFNKDGRIESWNKGAKIIFGYKNDEIIGKKLEKIFSKEDISTILNISRVLYNYEFCAKHKNKKNIIISATLTPIVYGEKNRQQFNLLIARDVTDQSKFQEELALKYKKMHEAYNQFGIIRRQMDYIFELLNLCNEKHEKNTIADFIVSSIIMITRVDACVLRNYNKEKKSLDLLSCFGLANDWYGKSSIKFEKSLAKKALEKGFPLKIIEITKETKYQSKHLAKKNNLSSLLLIPLTFRSEFIGSLSLYTTPEKKLEIFENEFIEKYAKVVELVLAATL